MIFSMKGVRRHNRGISLVEVLVAMAVLVIGILAIVKIFPEGFLAIQRTDAMAIADALAVYQIEELKAAGYDKLPDLDRNKDTDGVNKDFDITGKPEHFTPVIVEVWNGDDTAEFTPLKIPDDVTIDSITDPLKTTLKFVNPPAADDVIRVGYEVAVWKDHLPFSTTTKDGLEDGQGLVYVNYVDEVAARMVETQTPSTATSMKLVTIRISWTERGKSRHLSKRALFARER